jgi:hypothetical protein
MINFAKIFDVADEPIMEGLKLQLDAQSENADRSKLEEILEMAKERCPAIYSMTHLIRVQANLR